jgi:hypothetical protein
VAISEVTDEVQQLLFVEGPRGIYTILIARGSSQRITSACQYLMKQSMLKDPRALIGRVPGDHPNAGHDRGKLSE